MSNIISKSIAMIELNKRGTTIFLKIRACRAKEKQRCSAFQLWLVQSFTESNHRRHLLLGLKVPRINGGKLTNKPLLIMFPEKDSLFDSSVH